MWLGFIQMCFLFLPKMICYANDENVSWRKVVSSSPSGKQEKGTKATVTVSKGTAGKLVSESEYKITKNSM